MGRESMERIMCAPMTRRQLLRGALGVAGAAILSGCGAPTVPTPRPTVAARPTSSASTRLVRFAWWTDVGNMTPFQVSTVGPGGAVLLTLLFDTLTWKDQNGTVPWLASKWEAAPDGSSYTFTIRDGVLWHDGQPLTPDDVKFSFDYYSRHPYLWMPTEVVASAQVVGSRQVHVALKRPYAAFLDDIAGIWPIIPRHVWEGVSDPVKYTGANGTTGSGPFRFVSHDEAAGAYRFTANQGYWRGRPRVAEWQQITVPAEAGVQLVQNGGADVLLSTDASVVDLLGSNAHAKVFQTAPLSLVRLVINTEKPPLDQKAVRQAIAYALDRKRIAETITHGPAIVGSPGVVPPETPWYDPHLKQYAYDPEKARALLGGKTYNLTLLADADAREPELMQPMLQAVGITLQVQRVDPKTRIQLLTEGNFEMALTAHIGVGGDPDYLRRWYAGEEANGFAKGSIFHDAQYAKLGAEEASTIDPDKRRAIVFKMQEILADELPTIVLYHRRFYWVYNPDVFTPMHTAGGIMNGIPFPNNKLALISG